MRVDRGILLAVFFLMGLGLVQVYSSSYIFATETYGNGLYFFRRQALFAAFSLIALFVAYFLPWKISQRLGFILWGLAVVGVACTLIPGVGLRSGGAFRWLPMPFGLRFEPGELLRVTYPFVLAPLMAQYARNEWDKSWCWRLTAVMAPLLLLHWQPDFG